MTQELKVSGMTCGHCVRAVTEAIQARDPEARVQVDLPTGLVRADTTLDHAEITALVTAEGYAVTG